MAGDVAGVGGHHALGRDLADAVVGVVRHEQVAGSVDGQTAGVLELRGGSGALGEARRAAARQRGDGAVGGDLADAVVVGVGHVEGAGGVGDDGARVVELGARGRAVGVAGRARARHRRDGAVRRDAADAVVVVVRDQQRARGLPEDAVGAAQHRHGLAAVFEARHAGAGVGADGAVGRHLADHVVVGVGDVEVARGVEAGATRRHEHGHGGRAVGQAGEAVAGQGGHHAGGGHLAHALVGAVRHDQLASGVHGDAVGRVEERGGAGAVGVAVAAGDRADDARGRDLADAVVGALGDVEVARGIHRQGARVVELGDRAGAVGGAGRARAGQGGGGAVRGDLADAVVARVRHVDRAGGVHGHAAGAVELGGGGAALGVARAGAAAEGADQAGGRDLADGVVAGVGHVDVARSVHRELVRVVEARRGRDAVGQAGDALAGERRVGAVGRHAADAVVAAVGHVEVAGGVEGDALGRVEAGAGGAGEGRHGAVLGNLADHAVAAVRDVDIARGVGRHRRRAVEGGGGALAVGALAGAARAGEGLDRLRQRREHGARLGQLVALGGDLVELALKLVEGLLDLGQLGVEGRDGVAELGDLLGERFHAREHGLAIEEQLDVGLGEVLAGGLDRLVERLGLELAQSAGAAVEQRVGDEGRGHRDVGLVGNALVGLGEALQLGRAAAGGGVLHHHDVVEARRDGLEGVLALGVGGGLGHAGNRRAGHVGEVDDHVGGRDLFNRRDPVATDSNVIATGVVGNDPARVVRDDARGVVADQAAAVVVEQLGKGHRAGDAREGLLGGGGAFPRPEDGRLAGAAGGPAEDRGAGLGAGIRLHRGAQHAARAQKQATRRQNRDATTHGQSSPLMAPPQQRLYPCLLTIIH
ncbi:hypothetical protein D3C72_614720 [compost metagenome]